MNFWICPACDLFKVKLATKFSRAINIYQSYTKASLITLCDLVPFASTYLCEAGFSTLVNINTNRNKLDVGDDMRLTPMNARP